MCLAAENGMGYAPGILPHNYIVHKKIHRHSNSYSNGKLLETYVIACYIQLDNILAQVITL
jgi:hypothetical protein